MEQEKIKQFEYAEDVKRMLDSYNLSDRQMERVVEVCEMMYSRGLIKREIKGIVGAISQLENNLF